MTHPTRILVLAPHTDDGELGCGGSIARYASQGKQVYYAAFSDCKRSLKKELPPGTLQDECRKANALLGIAQNNIIFFDHDVRTFPACRQEILEEMVKLNQTI